MNLRDEALVIGGGIGGLSLARAFAASGIAARVYERAADAAPAGAGLMLHPGAMRALRELGLDAAVEEAGEALRRGHGVTFDGKVLQTTDFSTLRDQVGAGTFGIHRARLHQILLRGASNVEFGRTFVRYEEDDSGVTAYFDDGTSARGSILVGADGLRSAVRAQLLGAEPPRYAGYTSWRGVADGTDFFPNGELSEFWGRGARFGVVPIGGGQTYWFATANAAEGQADVDPVTELAARFASWSPRIAALLAATPAERILRTDIYDRDPVKAWSNGRVTLLGDAAHPMTPNLGQGACMAIEDALILARSLVAESTDIASAFAKYERARRPRTARFVKSSRQFGYLGQLENGAAIWFRNLMLRATPQSVVQKQLVENARFEP